MRQHSSQRRVTVMARIVRHKGAQFRGAPLGRHISYLQRDGVTHDGKDANMFDGATDGADRDAFAHRCEDDRHHFRFIVSPEDASELGDLRTFTRDLMNDVAIDLRTDLDWVAVDHWNTDNPHIHILVRGVAADGTDLVIDRGYVSEGIRIRAQERVTLELGVRTELQIQSALEREVDAEYWTSLDRTLEHRSSEAAGIVDLRPDVDTDTPIERLLRGRVAKLETLGLAAREGPGVWIVEPDARDILRDLSERTDIIKTMHRAMAADNRAWRPDALAMHPEAVTGEIVGRLIERGLHDELAGSAYAIVDGADGRVHHLRFSDLEMTGDGARGSIVELRRWEDNEGRSRLSLATRSDWPLDVQVGAPGATWLDRQLVSREPVATANGFGLEIRNAMNERAAFLETQGLASWRNGRWVFASGLIGTLKTADLEKAAGQLAARMGKEHQPAAAGDDIHGLYRERVTLSSGRFAMIDDGLGFQLVPWRPALDKYLGHQVNGTMSATGSIDWKLGRSMGIGL